MKVTIFYAAQEGLAQPLPMLAVDVIGDVQPHLASLGSEGSSMPPFPVRVFQGIGYFFGIVAYLRQGGVVHGGDELAGHRLGQDVLPDGSTG